jgi:Arc/MetJ-type ribon-helix-helix transcriptional regulator
MSSKMISVSIPETMLPEIDAAARREHRSRSELIREVLRRYLAADRGRMVAIDDAQPDEVEAIRRGRAEFERGEFVRLEDLQRELGLPTR